MKYTSISASTIALNSMIYINIYRGIPALLSPCLLFGPVLCQLVRAALPTMCLDFLKFLCQASGSIAVLLKSSPPSQNERFWF